MKKNKRTSKFYILAIFTFIFFSVTGYAFFNETIHINGTAKNSDYFTNNKLQVNLTKSSTYYTTGTFRRITLSSEDYDGINNLNTYFTVNDNTTTNRANTYKISFTNPYSINLTNGSVSLQIISGTFSSTSVTINRTTLKPNQTGTVTLKMTHKNRTVGNAQARVTVQYRLNGVTKYFYFTVFISWQKNYKLKYPLFLWV